MGITGVQILTVILPSAYERSIMQKKAAFEQAVEQVNSETSQLVNTYNNTVTVMMREATAQAHQIEQNARAQARYNTIMAEAAAYKEAQDQLSLNSEQLAAY